MQAQEIYMLVPHPYPLPEGEGGESDSSRQTGGASAVRSTQPLDDAALRQIGDLLLGVADGREDLLVVRAQLGGSIAQR